MSGCRFFSPSVLQHRSKNCARVCAYGYWQIPFFFIFPSLSQQRRHRRQRIWVVDTGETRQTGADIPTFPPAY